MSRLNMLPPLVQQSLLVHSKVPYCRVNSTALLAPRRYLQIDINSVKRGAFVRLRDKIWAVEESTHHKQGRGGAHYKLHLRDVVRGGKAQERFNSGQAVEVVQIETKELQFLYADEDLHLMDPNTFEEHSFPMGIFTGGKQAIPFLLDAMPLQVDYDESSEPVVVRMPERFTYKVLNTPPAASTGTNESKGTMFKAAEIGEGAQVQVPEFVSTGDMIVVDLVNNRYVSRA